MYIHIIFTYSCNGNSVKLIDKKDKEKLSEGNGSVRTVESSYKRGVG